MRSAATWFGAVGWCGGKSLACSRISAAANVARSAVMAERKPMRRGRIEFPRNRNKVERLVSSGLIVNRRRDAEWARSII
jgi:hypothetical protein